MVGGCSAVAQEVYGRCNIGSITGASGIRGYEHWWCGFTNDKFIKKENITSYEAVVKHFDQNFNIESVVGCYEFANTSSIRVTNNWTSKPHENYSPFLTCCSFMDVVDLIYNQVSWLYFPGGYYGIRSFYETGFGPGISTDHWTIRIGWFEDMYKILAEIRGIDPEILLSPIRIGEYSYSDTNIQIDLPTNGQPGKTGKINVANTEITTYTNSANRTFIMYKQAIGPWSTYQYKNSTVAEIGCPTTAIACALTGIGCSVTPLDFIVPAQVQSIEEILKQNSNNAVRVDSGATNNSIAEIIGHLQEGSPIVYHVNSNSQFTNSEHWMTLLDVNDDCTQLYVATGSTSSGNTEAWYSIETALKGMDRYYLVYP